MFKSNIIKKVLTFFPLLIAVVLLYGTVTGKIEKQVKNAKHKIVNTKSEKEKAGEETYPPGKITSLKEAFEWEDFGIPAADEYDPDNKISGGVYGKTKAEIKYMEELRKYEKKYDEEHPLEERYEGLWKYNPNRVLKVGQEFEVKSKCLTIIIEGIEFKENIKDIDMEYVNPNGRGCVLPYIDESGKMNPGVLYEDVLIGEDPAKQENWSRKEYDNNNVIFAAVHLSVSGQSEWIQEVYQLYPDMVFLNRDGDLLYNDLGNLNRLHGSRGENIILGLGSVFYDDLGFYDFENCNRYEYTSYPIRKGETVEFTVMYAVPEVSLDRAYLIYGDDSELYNENTRYNCRDITLVKLIE
ncbi:MAG: hypothetical protein K2M60_04585 [Lachnospiraceae bacterium]|nr:hypothetical protein [Lachnospiraceae bacterium]MDE6253137.1 hypothetical protein [Lachnospiraceae bacterium]